ncbi:MAG: hypothetical protein AB8B91_03525, partial [Rubripirellula sp.]
ISSELIPDPMAFVNLMQFGVHSTGRIHPSAVWERMEIRTIAPDVNIRRNHEEEAIEPEK